MRRRSPRWSPSHGSLLRDPHNRVSVNGFPLPGGRFALSRSCEGPPRIQRARRPPALHAHPDPRRQGLAGRRRAALRHLPQCPGARQPVPPVRARLELLEPIELPDFHVPRTTRPTGSARAGELGLPALEPLRDRLLAGRPVRFGFAGDRTALAECLIGSLAPEAVRKVSFATSLQPSSDRPFVLSLVDNRKQRA